MNCGKISKSLILASCAAAIVGVGKRIIFVNYDDIDREASQVSGNVCSDLVLKSGANGFAYESEKNSWETSSPLVNGTYKKRFDHSVLGRIFLRTQEIKDELIAMANSKVVAIVENLDNTAETKYEIYGYDSGLEMTDLQSVSTDADGVLYSFTAASGTNAKESQLPLSFFKTSLEATETALNALIAK